MQRTSTFRLVIRVTPAVVATCLLLPGCEDAAEAERQRALAATRAAEAKAAEQQAAAAKATADKATAERVTAGRTTKDQLAAGKAAAKAPPPPDATMLTVADPPPDAPFGEPSVEVMESQPPQFTLQLADRSSPARALVVESVSPPDANRAIDVKIRASPNGGSLGSRVRIALGTLKVGDYELRVHVRTGSEKNYQQVGSVHAIAR